MQGTQTAHMMVIATGASITTAAASAQVTIPNTSAGTKPRYIRVSATAAAHVRIGKDATITATTNDTLVQPGCSITLSVPLGYNNIAAIQSAAAGTVQIAPLEDA